MIIRAVPAALILVVCLSAGLSAQTLRTDTGPSELPPENYTANQYVDSRGCVYIRAGYAGQVTWIPRVTRDRKLVCRQTPSSPQTVAAPVAPLAVPVVKAAPVQPSAKPAAQKPVRVVKVSAPKPRKATAPTRISVNPAPAGPAPRGIPDGFEAAWDDDRLNPRRGQGTATGQAQMDRIWTTAVPKRLIEERDGTAIQHVKKPYVTPVKARASTKSAPRKVAPPSGAPQFVQVGVFGVRSNTQATVARLQALGLPVHVRSIQSKGRTLDVVMAGPFRQQASSKSALAAVHKAGYRDAHLRK